MNRDSLPEDYTLGLAAFDAVPVILFGMASRLLARMTGSVLVMLGGLTASLVKKDQRERAAIGKAVLRPAPMAFLLLSAAGIGAMIFCGKKLDSAQAKANWIEQGCNTAAQGSILAAMALIVKKLH